VIGATAIVAIGLGAAMPSGAADQPRPAATVATGTALPPGTLPPPPPFGQIHVTLTVDPGEQQPGASGQLVITGTVACDAPSTVRVNVFVSQSATIPVSGSASGEPMPCSATAVAWSEPVTAAPTSWQNGPATVQTSAVADAEGPPPKFGVNFAQQQITVVGASPPANPAYYLALGDSLATGFAAGAGEGYVDLLQAHYRQRFSNLTEVDFGCSGESTQSMLDGSLCKFGNQSQEDAAVAFLRAHPGQVKFATIDIGGNDLVFCGDITCFTNALATIDTNLATIMSRLRDAAGPDTPIIGMNYFNPLLGNWLNGASGQAFANATTGLLDTLNQHLAADYAAAGAPTADVATGFAVDDTTLVPSQWGTVPLNVRNACTWLDITCNVGAPPGFGDDANAAGYQVIAAAFIPVIDASLDAAAAPSTTTTTTAPPSTTTTSSQPAVEPAAAIAPAEATAAAPAFTG
jgi:lysophospholipase L1-like esterase